MGEGFWSVACFPTESSRERLERSAVIHICKIHKLQERLHLSECKKGLINCLETQMRKKIAEVLYSKDDPVDVCHVKVYTDRNVFYRALWKTIFVHEERHIELRVTTVLELVNQS